MGKVINITEKLSKEKPSIQIGEKVYEINNSVQTVFGFEELVSDKTFASFKQAITSALGEKAVEEIKLEAWSMENFQVLSMGIMAAMQGLEYEEVEKQVEARFQASKSSVL